MIVRYFLLWLPMIALAFANAALRELVLARRFPNLRAHQLSTITLMIFCMIYITLIFPVLRLENVKQALLAGFMWMVLTILFEFSLGRLLKRSWTELLQQYNLTSGHIWPVFLLFLLLLPFLLYSIKQPG